MLVVVAVTCIYLLQMWTSVYGLPVRTAVPALTVLAPFLVYVPPTSWVHAVKIVCALTFAHALEWCFTKTFLYSSFS